MTLRVEHTPSAEEIDLSEERDHARLPKRLLLTALRDLVVEINRVVPGFQVPASVLELRDRVQAVKDQYDNVRN